MSWKRSRGTLFYGIQLKEASLILPWRGGRVCKRLIEEGNIILIQKIFPCIEVIVPCSCKHCFSICQILLTTWALSISYGLLWSWFTMAIPKLISQPRNELFMKAISSPSWFDYFINEPQITWYMTKRKPCTKSYMVLAMQISIKLHCFRVKILT